MRMMTAEDIKKAINAGHKVFWNNTYYPVIKDNIGQFLITCTMTDYCVGLTWQDGVTLNGDNKAFFIED